MQRRLYAAARRSRCVVERECRPVRGVRGRATRPVLPGSRVALTDDESDARAGTVRPGSGFCQVESDSRNRLCVCRCPGRPLGCFTHLIQVSRYGVMFVWSRGDRLAAVDEAASGPSASCRRGVVPHRSTQRRRVSDAHSRRPVGRSALRTPSVIGPAGSKLAWIANARLRNAAQPGRWGSRARS